MSKPSYPVAISRLSARHPPDYPSSNPPHHVGSPPTSFCNPWPSAGQKPSLVSLFTTRFGPNRNFVPVPKDRAELVQVRKPDWGANKAGLKATWIGHASFLIETTTAKGAERGVRILLDPVFSERTSPYQSFGPKRYTPTPCGIEELPEVDLVIISHNHYDHLDAGTIKEVDRLGKGRVRYLCGLGNKGCFEGLGVRGEDVVEMDWWDRVGVVVEGVGKVEIVCTPAQHNSGRTIWSMSAGLWCSWVIEDDIGIAEDGPVANGDLSDKAKKLYFAGDTGYRTRPSPEPEDLASLPHCPAFSEIGDLYGPFDLALLPIGLYSPPSFMSSVHCAPEDSVCVHKDIKSKKSIGMHWGTVRGGLSGQYEDVREPPQRWRESCEKAGLIWGDEAGLCDIGETVVISS